MNESIRLLSTKDGADKEYRVQLESKGGGFIVTGFNGRRGGPLKAQPKITSPVPYDEAKKAFDALVKSKLKGGYNPADAGAEYVVPADIGTPTGIKLHLLTQVPESDVDRYINDDRYLAQEKFDGERRPVARRETVIGSNKNGFQTTLPAAVVDVLSALPQDTEIDTEQVGEVLYVFDVMKIAGECQRDVACLERKRKVDVLVNRLGNPANIVSIETAVGTAAKRALYARLRAERKEGIDVQTDRLRLWRGQDGRPNQDQVHRVRHLASCLDPPNEAQHHRAGDRRHGDCCPARIGHCPGELPHPARRCSGRGGVPVRGQEPCPADLPR
jgi:hypothetical protein